MASSTSSFPTSRIGYGSTALSTGLLLSSVPNNSSNSNKNRRYSAGGISNKSSNNINNSSSNSNFYNDLIQREEGIEEVQDDNEEEEEEGEGDTELDSLTPLLQLHDEKIFHSSTDSVPFMSNPMRSKPKQLMPHQQQQQQQQLIVQQQQQQVERSLQVQQPTAKRAKNQEKEKEKEKFESMESMGDVFSSEEDDKVEVMERAGERSQLISTRLTPSSSIFRHDDIFQRDEEVGEDALFGTNPMIGGSRRMEPISDMASLGELEQEVTANLRNKKPVKYPRKQVIIGPIVEESAQIRLELMLIDEVYRHVNISTYLGNSRLQIYGIILTVLVIVMITIFVSL